MNNNSSRSASPSRPRGRPKSEAKHREILDAAGECFLERGLSETSMDQIAQRAGVSKQTVYSHFNSKDELFQGVIRAKCAHYRFDTQAAAATEYGSPAEGLYDITRRYLELALDPQVVAMNRQLAAQSMSSSEMAQLFFQAGPLPTIRCVADFLSRHQAAGRLRGLEDLQTHAADYVHETGARFKFELMMNLRDEVGPRERERYVRRRVDEFLAAYDAHTGS